MLTAGPWVHKEQGGARISSGSTGHSGKAPERNRDLVPGVCALTTIQHALQLLYSYFTPQCRPRGAPFCCLPHQYQPAISMLSPVPLQKSL